jgi:rubrerythrin
MERECAKMSATNSEPWKFASLDELLAIARAMEQEAIDGYVALSKRMTLLGRLDLAQVFDSLVLEETGHLHQVQEWRSSTGQLQATIEVNSPENLYDEEGAGLVAPELLSACRAFSVAVRNEERAFMFWTYVSANAQSHEISQAAERMAREELGHVAKLRRERRKAFHMEKAKAQDSGETDLSSLEATLSRQLDRMASEIASGTLAEDLRRHGEEAWARSESIAQNPFDIGSSRRLKTPRTADKALPLSELLLDYYLDIGDHTTSEPDADRTRGFAAQLIPCLRAVRSVGN